MKRLYLTLLIVFLLVACNNTAVVSTSTAVPPQPSVANTPTPHPTNTPAPTAVPTATPTPVPDFLAATLDEGVDLDHFNPRAPFVLHFNQPMNAALSRPLLFAPTMQGEFSWSDDHTTLTFIPHDYFQPGRSYQINLHASLESATGLRFEGVQRWRVTTYTLPKMVSHLPQGTELTDRQPEIRLSFDRAMNQASVEAALQVEPVIPLVMAWQGNILVITPQERLAYSTTYHFTLADTAVSQLGDPLLQSYTWEYSLDDALAHLGKPNADNPTAPITLEFNYPIDPDSLDLVIEPAVDGKLTWNSDHTIAVFTPNDRLPTDTEYGVSFASPLRDMFGDEIPMSPPINFTTPPPILATSPTGSGINPAVAIRVVFDRPMDEASTAESFTITPTVPGKMTWEETTLIFTPDADAVLENTKYTVTIAPTAQSAEGEVILVEPYSWSFTTEEYEEVAGFGWGPNAQVLDANGRRAVQYQYYGRSSDTPVTFELYNLTITQFLDRYASGFRGVVGWEPYQPISTANTEFVTSWPAEGNISVESWGGTIYETIVPADVPPGLYILNLNAGRLNSQLILVLTANTLTVKQAENQIVAWVTDINGAAKPGVEVSVYARDGELIAIGTADANGVFRTQVDRDPEPLIVVAQNGNDITASGLTWEWQNYGGYYGDWWRPRPTTQDYTAYVYTERPIYQPGQTVYFKAIIRQDDDAILSVLPAGTAVTARIRDARNNVVQTLTLTANDFGTVNGEFQLAEGAMLGEWVVEIVTATGNGRDSSAHRQIFKVEEYRKPDYQVTVTTNEKNFIPGETVEVTVDSRYFFGEPVPDANIEIRFYDLQANYWWEEAEVGAGEGGDYTWYESYEYNTRTGKTDENGRFTFTITTQNNGSDDYEEWGSSLLRSSLGIEATVDDGSHQTVSGYAIIHTFNAAEGVKLESLNYFQTPGEPFTVNAAVKDIDGRPVNGRTLTLTLRRYSTSSYNYSTVVQTAELTTNENGQASLPFTIQTPGYYQLRVTGETASGRVYSYNTWVYAFRDGWWDDWYGRNNDLTISADKESYIPGDTAQLLIESSFSGSALLTFERGTVRRERLVELTAPVTIVEVPVLPEDAPNIFVTVNAWQASDTNLHEEMWESLADSQLYQASTELVVPVTDKTLIVTITPNKTEYAPREEASFTVRVTNQAGEPVSAEVSLAMVDEAIFALSDDLSGPLFDAFYYRRANILRTYDSMEPSRYLGGGGWGGGGGDGGLLGNPRHDFRDTAAWFPVLHTDFNGEVVITITLPDNLTSWRLTAKAVTADTQVGETITNITTKQDIIVRPILPTSLTAGDTVQISAVVHNYSPLTQEATVSLTIDHLQLTIDHSPTQTITLDPGEVRMVGWQVTAVSAGTTQLTVQAIGERANDAVQLPLEIRPLAIPDVTTEVGQFSGMFNTTVELPTGALPMSTVHIELSRSIAGSMLTGLEYLTGYPYGCVEQTMSRALPNAVVARALNDLGVSNPTLQAELPGLINASLQRLYGYQHNDGGWGWWYDDSTHDYQTAWVVFGLATIADAGYEVDPGVIERGVTWLNDNLSSMDIRTRAYALYSMAVAGQPNVSTTLALAEQLDELDTFSQAGLALALYEAGEVSRAREIVDGLAETAVTGNGFVHWEGDTEDGHYYHKTMASDIRSTALALSAFAQIRPGHELEGGIVRWLMSQRGTYGWGSTNETSYTILALTDHLLATSFSENAANTGYTVKLNGTVVASGNLGRGEPAVTLEIPADQLQTGSNALQITQSGSGQLYYTINNRVYVAQEEITAAGSVQIVRTYYDPETNKPITSVTPGQLVKVVLRVTMPQDSSFVIVEDNLPGGLEALNEGLNTTSHIASEYEWNEPEYFWSEYGYNYKEIRNGRVSFFITTFDAGSRTITYMARATHAGEFVSMPVEVYAMYDVTVWGRSASSEFVIAE